MEPEDLYPNDSSYFLPTEPQDQVIARRKEKASTLEAINVLKEVVQRLEDRIAFYASVDSIPAAVKAKPQQFLIVFNANQLTRDNLRSEKEYIEQLIADHAK